MIVEAEPIDECFLLRIPENPWLQISGLSLRRDRADFDETEAERRPRRERDSVLIESGSQADGIWEIETEDRFRFCGRPKRVERAERVGHT